MIRLLFLSLLLGVTACTPLRVQQPDLDLGRVHEGGAYRIAFSPSGRRLASGGANGDVRVWSVADGRRLADWPVDGDSITGLLWLDESRLLSADAGGHLQLRNVDEGTLEASLGLGSVQAVAAAPDASWLVVAQGERFRRLALPSLQILGETSGGSRILSLAVDHAGERIAVSTRDGRVRLLDADLEKALTLPRASRDVWDLRFSPDDRTLVAAGWFRIVEWNLDRGTLEERPTEHLGKVASVDVSPDGRRLLSLGRITDSGVRLVDAESNRVLRRYKPHALCGRLIRFSPDGRHAASAAEDGSVYIYDLDRPYRPKVYYGEGED